MHPRPPWVEEVEPARPEAESRPSASPAYRSVGFPGALPDPRNPTIGQLWRKSADSFPNRPCLGALRDASTGGVKYGFQSYKDVDRIVKRIAGPLEMFTSTTSRNIGIFSDNCPEWMIGFLGCMRAGLCAVPIYDSPEAQSVEHIISHAELPLVMVSASNLGRLASALEIKRGKNIDKVLVRCVLYWPWPGVDQDEISQHISAIAALGCEVFSFKDFQERRDVMLGCPRPDTLATILYSTGSTGDTKGVMLTHRQLITCLTAFAAHLKLNGFKFRPKDSFLAYLSIAHSFELCMELLILQGGGKIGYSLSGCPKSILEDARAIKPTVFLGIPSVMEHLVEALDERVKSSFVVRKLLFHWGYSRKKAFMSHGIPVGTASPVFDSLVFGKFHGLLGGRQRFMLSFGNPLTSSAQERLTVCMRCPYLQGYGTAEGLPVFVPHLDRMDMIGTVGAALPSVTWRIESVPDLGYDALDEQKPAGELVLKSPQLFEGYYKQPDLSKECYDQDGWFHSGDMGIVQDGCFKITDLKENIVTLSNGKLVSVDAVEKAYEECTAVSQIWVYGDSTREALAAIVVPDKATLQEWAESESKPSDYETLCKDPGAVEFVSKMLTSLAEEKRLCQGSTVQAVRLSSECLATDSKFFTPASKLNRHGLAEKFKKEIEEMYSELHPTQTSTPIPNPAWKE
ncbi:hypothetical protein BSKO_04253 [Bryopsis sp. KO-2023]|nr:hypothetical protein BSKO_04253 [Bryopsis sp. KO-2023]